MKLSSAPRQPFVGLALLAATGVIFADFFPFSPSTLLAISMVVAICAFLVLRWPSLIATYAIVGAGFFLLHNLRSSNTEGQQLAAQIGNRPRVLTATGFVISEPKIAPNGFATFSLKLESIELEGRKQRTHASWLVRWRGTPEYGDELRLFGIAEVNAPPRNPGEFDMGSYLARRDVRRTFFVRYPEDGALIQHGAGNPILRAAQKSRGWMQNTLCRGLEGSPDVQNFLSGIVLGLRHQTPEDIEEPFQQTGTLHLFAVAGLHVGIVAALLWMLATVARLSRKWATALIIPSILFYAAVTGLHVSSVRAAVMTSILLGGFFFERKVFVLNSLAAAAFFLLCWNTNELFSTILLGGGRNHSVCRSAVSGFATLGRSRPFFAAEFATWPASSRANWFRMVMPWRLRFARGLARFAAIRALVLSYRHADFLVGELGSCSYCLLHSGNRAALASVDATTAVGGCHFQ